MPFPRNFSTPLFNEPDAFADVGRETDDRLTGGNKADKLFGGLGDDRLSGRGGTDNLNGGSGKDLLDGGNGNDKLRANTGDDKLSGGNGHDSLFGGAGDDILNGGNGNDLLQGGSDDDIYKLSSGKDVIFDNSGDDRLDFGAVGFESLRFTVLDVIDGDHHANSDGLVDTLLIRGAGFQLMIVDYFDNTAARAGDNGAGEGLVESFDFSSVSVGFDTIHLLVANLEADGFLGL